MDKLPQITKKVFLFFIQPPCCYHRLLCHFLYRSVRYSAFFIVSVLSVFSLSCNNEDSSSPYAAILSQPPYASLTDSIKKEPRQDGLYFRRAILLNKNNLPEPALADFKKAWSLSKQESYAVGASNILIEKNKNEAISFLLEALKELPESIFMQLSLARLYDEQNKTNEALTVCDAILEQQHDQVNALMLKSELFQKKGDTTGSTAALEKAYQLVPDNMDIGYKLAYQYAENKNAKVITLTDSLIAKDSLKLHAEPYYVKGMYYSNTGDRAKAIQLFNETIRMDYNFLNAYIEKGKIFLEQKKVADALKTFQLANTISPAFADAWYWIGRCQEALGQKEDAKLSYEKAYSLDKTFTEAKEAADSLK